MATRDNRMRTEQVVTTAARPARERDETIEREIPRTLNLRDDRVRWGPVLAGLVTALTSLLLLSLLGLAVGLTVVNAGDAAIQGGAPTNTGRNAAIWAAISALISFLIGGYIAGKTAAVFDHGWGALNGLLVFLVSVPVILWLASQGLGAVLGGLGSFAGSLNVDANTTQNAAQQAQQAAQQVQPADVARTAERVRNTAWNALLISSLGLASAALGGALGTRRQLEVNTRTGEVHE